MTTEEHYEVTIEALFAQARGNVDAAGFAYAQAYRNFGAEAFWAQVGKYPKDEAMHPKLLVALLMRNGISKPMMPQSTSSKPSEPAREKALRAFLALPETDKSWLLSRMQEIANELG